MTWPLRIAELGSRLGAMPDQIVCTTLETDQTQPIFKYQQYWSALYRRHRSRLAVLQAWDPQLKADPAITGNPIQGYSVGELTTDQGLTFTLRKSADVADPFDSGAAGLNGGVEWGAEFRATYQALQRNPVTPTGELRGLYFSSLGAYGYQKAAFANKKVVISTNVAMGDTFYYAIEEVGKIGCFWNKAKHVVVYERTVWPTLQFAGEQTNHYRQPIIRKILEYCEITQARRNYPDYSGADHPPFKRGFLLSRVFPKTVIRVNSQWGRDITDNSKPPDQRYLGFEIPLWRPGEDEIVYPRPSIQLEVSTKTAPTVVDQTTPAGAAGRPFLPRLACNRRSQTRARARFSIPKMCISIRWSGKTTWTITSIVGRRSQSAIMRLSRSRKRKPGSTTYLETATGRCRMRLRSLGAIVATPTTWSRSVTALILLQAAPPILPRPIPRQLWARISPT